ncbi:hypothetical protein [Prevotella sp.]|uniref:hypothetical protein n=1 Tax=Prevotella sp. TaxID=59823 RepID=UPI002647DB8A|nr:hypothetical protein [Prevotella sp.]MDN5552945.1 hypothetical protein [Prevotella sp.]
MLRYYLKRIILWVFRMGYSRGFGVQSPSAYSFLRYVVNEHYPYYAYQNLKDESGDVSPLITKLSRFYFRMANFSQSEFWYDYKACNDIYQKYVVAGCKSTSFVSFDEIDSIDTFQIARMSLYGDYQKVYNHLASIANNDSLLIIENIKRDKITRKFWKQVVKDNRTFVTYDLYYCGVVFFDSNKCKCNYMVNF